MGNSSITSYGNSRKKRGDLKGTEIQYVAPGPARKDANVSVLTSCRAALGIQLRNRGNVNDPYENSCLRTIIADNGP